MAAPVTQAMCHDYGSCILSHRSWCGCACHELITVASHVGVPLMGLCLPPHLCRQAQALEFPVPGSDSCAVLCICSRALAVYKCESRVAWSLLLQAFKVHKSGVRSEGLPAARSRLLFVNSFALPLPELEWYSFSPLSMGSFWRFTPTRQRLAGAPDLTRPERAIRMMVVNRLNRACPVELLKTNLWEGIDSEKGKLEHLNFLQFDLVTVFVLSSVWKIVSVSCIQCMSVLSAQSSFRCPCSVEVQL